MLLTACEAFVSVEDFFAHPSTFNVDDVDDAALVAELIDQASDLLAMLSGGRVSGRCNKVVRPHGHQRGSAICEGNCRVDRIHLGGPDLVVNDVYIDGVAIDASTYGIEDQEWLVKISYDDTRPTGWPLCQDMWKPITEVDTFAIDYTVGILPKLAEMAAIEVVNDLLNFWYPKGRVMPPGATGANVGGVNIQLRERVQAAREGDANLPWVARFLSVYAPDGPTPSSVWSPELRPHDLHMTDLTPGS